MLRHQTEPRAGGQPEGSDDDPRGEAESRPLRHIKATHAVAFIY